MDYHALGLKCGIEIHQQLDTREKLFCNCPTRLRETSESNLEFYRYLRAAPSEMGEVDRAAAEEVKIQRKYIYKAYDSTCLVENDEEPPRRLNRDALDIALTLAKMLRMQTVDELHTMRKIVVDGSNTTGFQRTALVATDGFIECDGRVGIDVLCLEEEAAQKISEDGESVTYSLDRLGIPLVEIGTAPDIRTPRQAREVAAYLGMVLRSTGRVKRGLGTIRQDVNISITEGARVEIKGVQELDLLPLIVEREVERQVNLLKVRDELLRRNARVPSEIVDLTEVFQETGSRVLRRTLDGGGVILGVRLEGFGGLVGRELVSGRRLGSEFSDHAKKSGAGGIFHTDELPGYGITEEEVERVRGVLGASQDDCVVLVGDEESRAMGAIRSVLDRARAAIRGVPEEVRRALPDGNSAYMRPLPGAARMYPETDVPPVAIREEYLERIAVPELLIEKKERFKEEYGLNEELARLIALSDHAETFEAIIKAVPEAKPGMVIRTLHTTLEELAKTGHKTERIRREDLIELFRENARGKIPNEAIEDLLKRVTEDPPRRMSEVLREFESTSLDRDDINELIERVVTERSEFVREEGLHAVGPLMGVLMKDLRGKMSGKEVSRMLRERIEAHLNE